MLLIFFLNIKKKKKETWSSRYVWICTSNIASICHAIQLINQDYYKKTVSYWLTYEEQSFYLISFIGKDIASSYVSALTGENTQNDGIGFASTSIFVNNISMNNVKKFIGSTIYKYKHLRNYEYAIDFRTIYDAINFLIKHVGRVSQNQHRIKCRFIRYEIYK